MAKYAGSPSTWIRKYWQKFPNVEVPCGECAQCCQNGIPDHMPLDSDGNCVHFDNGCTIYDSRPDECRSFDCRVYFFCDIESPVNVDWETELKTKYDEELLDTLRADTKMCGVGIALAKHENPGNRPGTVRL